MKLCTIERLRIQLAQIEQMFFKVGAMMCAKEVQEWMTSLNTDDAVAIGEGGLTLVVVGREDEAYLEVGGIRLDDESWEGE